MCAGSVHPCHIAPDKGKMRGRWCRLGSECAILDHFIDFIPHDQLVRTLFLACWVSSCPADLRCAFCRHRVCGLSARAGRQAPGHPESISTTLGEVVCTSSGAFGAI